MSRILHFRPWVGPKEGRYDRAFVRWCHRHGHLCLRTVELFCFFADWSQGQRPTFSVPEARKNWQQMKSEWKALVSALAARHEPESWYKTEFGPHGTGFYVSRYSPKECAEEVAGRDPGSWRDYLRLRRSRFRRQLADYQKASQFWSRCGPNMRKDLLRCLRPATGYLSSLKLPKPILTTSYASTLNPENGPLMASSR
jgi:hypothetical protein